MFEFEKQIEVLLSTHIIEGEFDLPSHTFVLPKLSLHCIPIMSDPLECYEILSNYKGQPIRIWEDQYKQHTEIINSRIKSLLGLNKRIYARLTSIKEIRQEELDEFLNQNHLNQATKAKYRYCLEYQNETVAVASFGRSCPVQFEGRTYQSNEMIRFCSKSGFNIVGGLSKLLKYFKNEVGPEHIMTYVDKEWSSGEAYRALGFKLVGETSAQEFWISPEDGRRYRENELSRRGVDYSLWRKISNLGNYKYVKIIDHGS